MDEEKRARLMRASNVSQSSVLLPVVIMLVVGALVIFAAARIVSARSVDSRRVKDCVIANGSRLFGAYFGGAVVECDSAVLKNCVAQENERFFCLPRFNESLFSTEPPLPRPESERAIESCGWRKEGVHSWNCEGYDLTGIFVLAALAAAVAVSRLMK